MAPDSLHSEVLQALQGGQSLDLEALQERTGSKALPLVRAIEELERMRKVKPLHEDGITRWCATATDRVVVA